MARTACALVSRERHDVTRSHYAPQGAASRNRAAASALTRRREVDVVLGLSVRRPSRSSPRREALGRRRRRAGIPACSRSVFTSRLGAASRRSATGSSSHASSALRPGASPRRRVAAATLGMPRRATRPRSTSRSMARRQRSRQVQVRHVAVVGEPLPAPTVFLTWRRAPAPRARRRRSADRGTGHRCDGTVVKF